MVFTSENGCCKAVITSYFNKLLLLRFIDIYYVSSCFCVWYILSKYFINPSYQTKCTFKIATFFFTFAILQVSSKFVEDIISSKPRLKDFVHNFYFCLYFRFVVHSICRGIKNSTPATVQKETGRESIRTHRYLDVLL